MDGMKKFFKKKYRPGLEDNSSVSIDDLSISADENSPTLLLNMEKASVAGTSKVNQPKSDSKQPDFTATIHFVKYESPQAKMQPRQVRNKVKDLNFAMTSTPLPGRISLRQKFTDEQLSPILQQQNVRRSYQSRIPLPQKRFSVRVLHETVSQQKELFGPVFNQKNKELNPLVVSKTGNRVTFESHGTEKSNVMHTSVSDSNKVSVSEGRKHTNRSESINKLDALPTKDNRCNYQHSKDNISLAGNKSKSILKKSVFTNNIFEDDDSDDDIFGISKSTKHRLTTFNSENSVGEANNIQDHQENVEQNKSVALKEQRVNKRNRRVLEEKNLDVKNVSDKMENNVQLMPSSRKISMNVTKEELNLKSLKSTISNHQTDNGEGENCKRNDVLITRAKKCKGKKEGLKKVKNVEIENSVTMKYNENVLQNEKIGITQKRLVNKNTEEENQNIRNEATDKFNQETDTNEGNQKTRTKKRANSKKENIEIENKNQDSKYKSEGRKNEKFEKSDDEDGVFRKGAKSNRRNLKKITVNTLPVNSDAVETAVLQPNSNVNNEKVVEIPSTKAQTRSKILKKSEKINDVNLKLNSKEFQKNAECKEKEIMEENVPTVKQRNVKNYSENKNVGNDHLSVKVIKEDVSVLESDVIAVKYNSRKPRRTKQKVTDEAGHLNNVATNNDCNVRDPEVNIKVQTKQKRKINVKAGVKEKEMETTVEVDNVIDTIEYVIKYYGLEEENGVNISSSATTVQECLTTNKRESLEENKLELSTKRLKKNESSTLILGRKRKVTVLGPDDDEATNCSGSSQGSRRSLRKCVKTTVYEHNSSQKSIENEKGTDRTTTTRVHNTSDDVSNCSVLDRSLVQMPVNYGVDVMPCFSSSNRQLKSLKPGVSRSLGIIVNDISCGGHIFIEPGKSYTNSSSNNTMYLVVKGTARVQIYTTLKVVEENQFFFVPNNVPYKITNKYSKKLILGFVKTPKK